MDLKVGYNGFYAFFKCICKKIEYNKSTEVDYSDVAVQHISHYDMKYAPKQINVI